MKELVQMTILLRQHCPGKGWIKLLAAPGPGAGRCGEVWSAGEKQVHIPQEVTAQV